MTVLVLLGPPGAGKGTQAARVSLRLGIPAVSTGEIFRSNIAEGTELGRLAQSYMARGEFVPDSVTDPMVRLRLRAPDAAGGFLLDGYPRTLDQAHALRDMLADMGVPLDLVLELEVDEDEVVARMLNRATEQNRADDTEPVIRRRLEVYHAQTEPMATYYADQDLLEVVSGVGTVDEVTERIFHVLDALEGGAAADDQRDDVNWVASHPGGEGECCGVESEPGEE